MQTQPLPRQGRNPVQKLENAVGKSADLKGFLQFDNLGGVDSSGDLAAAFGGGPRIPAYTKIIIRHEFVPEPTAPNYSQIVVSGPLLAHHEATIAHLADRSQGHLGNEHPLSAKFDYKRTAESIGSGGEKMKAPGTLIYAEVEVDPLTDRAKRITSFGQNYRYRWRFKDTVRTHWTPQRPKQHPMLVAHPEELKLEGEGKHRRPAKLTGVRLITGYAVDEENESEQGIGTGDFARMAGRLAINIAVEQLSPDILLNDYRLASVGLAMCCSRY